MFKKVPSEGIILTNTQSYSKKWWEKILCKDSSSKYWSIQLKMNNEVNICAVSILDKTTGPRRSLGVRVQVKRGVKTCFHIHNPKALGIWLQDNAVPHFSSGETPTAHSETYLCKKTFWKPPKKSCSLHSNESRVSFNVFIKLISWIWIRICQFLRLAHNSLPKLQLVLK